MEAKRRKMVIRRPAIKMVGKDDDKKPVILKTESQYKDEDLIFDFMIEDRTRGRR